MSIEKSSKSEDVLELHQVIDHLAQAEAALSALMQGQVDAYINPATATPRLLNEAQDWLLRSQQRLKQIHDAIACGVIVRDSNGVIVHANDLASKMLGIPLRQIVGRKYLDMPVPIIREDGSPFLSDEYPGIIAFQTGKLVRDVIMGVLNGNDQAVRWLLVTAQPLADPDDGRVTDVVTTLVDISQRVQAEKRVLQERQRIEVLLDLSPVGILVTDASGCILLTNQEMHRLWGLPLQIGEPLDAYYQSVTLKQSNGSVYPPEQFPLERAISNGEQVWAEEVHIELADGTVIPTLVNATLIYSGDGKFAGAILIMQDISALEEMNKLRTEFLGMVSHELKNPLSNIKGASFVGLKSRMPLDFAEVFELLDIIHKEAQRMQSIMDDLLDINRIEANLIPLAPEPQSLEEILQEAREVFSRSSRSNHLVINISEGLPLVRVDRRRILQVLQNLLDNACKYSPPSSLISIEVEAEPAYVTVQVKDRGWGIPPDKIPLLFNKFVRLDKERGNTAVPGIGLGLAICKGIVEAHGGRIWASSPGEGQGATFSFTLPVYADQPAADDDKIQDIDADSPGKGATILVVDDEPHGILIIKRLLSEAGYRPVTTTNPFQVTPLIELESPDLVLLDIRFPQASGFELFKEIRKCSHAPIIFLTASDQEDDTKQASELGAADYITKPYSATELLARIETVLRQQRVRR